MRTTATTSRPVPGSRPAPKSNGHAAAFWQLLALEEYIPKGMYPVPLTAGTGVPCIRGWPDLRLATAEEIGRHFPKNTGSLGVLLGVPVPGKHAGLMDVDLDSAEARAAADFLLPPTGMIFGRKGSPASHRFYAATDTCARSDKFEDPTATPAADRKILVELRGTKLDGTVGYQARVPPSTHRSGEVITYQTAKGQPADPGEPSLTTAAELQTAVGRLAAAALLARYWPAHGRHDCMLALAGALAGLGWKEAETAVFCEALYRAVPTHDRRAVKRARREVKDTFKKLAAGEPATGLPTLKNTHFAANSQIVDCVFAWLSGEAAELRSKLILSEKGGIRSLLANAITLLSDSPEWDGVLGYNEFSLKTIPTRTPPFEEKVSAEWRDCDDTATCAWLQHHGCLVNTSVVNEAVYLVAQRRAFHPVRDYLESLTWDGAARIEEWLSTYLGVQNNAYTRAIGPRWLMSAVARVMKPGCQADYTLILKGAPGTLKSQAFRTLAVKDDWFTDHISELGSKDSRVELAGKWIVEMSELGNLRTRDLEHVKAFLTACVDCYRPPYGRRSVDVPRQCVFGATTNNQQLFIDETGNRRFWPIQTSKIKLDQLKAERDQLWAEAYRRFLDGDPWWLERAKLDTLAEAEQDKYYEPGVWDEKILAWVDGPIERSSFKDQPPNKHPLLSTRDSVRIDEILEHALGLEPKHWKQTDQKQVARCLTHAGWTRKKVRLSKHPQWCYERPKRNFAGGSV